MILVPLISLLVGSQLINSAVLDPALYLAPSPPLRLTGDSPSPGDLWTKPVQDKTERITREATTENAQTTEKTMDKETGRMFWSRYQQPALGVHIPLSFSLSGTYGKFAGVPSVVANTYTSSGFLPSSGKSALTGSVYGSYGRPGFAGTSYGNYGQSVRVYGGDNTPSWSGWGNGKWGHYGKG